MTTDLDGATTPGEPGTLASTPGEWAARWNAADEEQRAAIVRGLQGLSEDAHRCFTHNHEGRLRDHEDAPHIRTGHHRVYGIPRDPATDPAVTVTRHPDGGWSTTIRSITRPAYAHHDGDGATRRVTIHDYPEMPAQAPVVDENPAAEALLPLRRTPDDDYDGHTTVIDATGCTWSSAIGALTMGVLGWCGCGYADQLNKDVWDVLTAVRTRWDTTDEAKGKLTPIPDRIDEMHAETILNVLDHAGLLEHGGSIGGAWLTDLGRQWMTAITEPASEGN